MIPKRILVPARLRRPSAPGWSWVDRRFVREHADGEPISTQFACWRTQQDSLRLDSAGDWPCAPNSGSSGGSARRG
jgi:hypothetical protein